MNHAELRRLNAYTTGGIIIVMLGMTIGLILGTAFPEKANAHPNQTPGADTWNSSTRSGYSDPWGDEWDPIQYNGSPCAFYDPGGFWTYACLINGRAAVGIQTSGRISYGFAQFLPFLFRDVHTAYIQTVYVTTNCGSQASGSCHARVVHDDGTYVDTLSTNGDNVIAVNVNHWENAVRVWAVDDTGTFNDMAISSITITYDTSTVTPSATVAATVTSAPTNTLIPTWTPFPSFTPIPGTTYPTATATLMSTRWATPPARITPDDGCPVDLAIQCPPPVNFGAPNLPPLILPSPTLRVIAPTITPQIVTPYKLWTDTPTPGGSGYGPTATPISANGKAGIDDSGIKQFGGQLVAAAQTMMPLGNNDMGGINFSNSIAQIGGNLGYAVSFFKAIEATDLNRPAGIISFMILLFALNVLFEVISFILPFALWIIGWAFRIIQVLKPF